MNSWTDGTMEAEAGAGAEAEGALKVFIFAQRQGEVQKAKRPKQKEKGEKLGAKPCVKYIIWHWQRVHWLNSAFLITSWKCFPTSVDALLQPPCTMISL